MFLPLNRDLPTLALAWCLSRARCGSWSSDRRSFSVTATRPRPPDEMGCQDGGHSGFEGCARNFCGCQHCCFLLRAGMTASPLSAFKTFYASTLHPRSGGRQLTWGKKFKTVRASDGLQHAKPFWHRYFGSLSAKLETILDGCFTLIHSRQQQLAHEAYISAIIRRGKMTSWHSEFMQWSSHGGTMLLELMQQAESTPRVMSKLRGKCGHQFRCVEGVLLFLVPFNQFVGGPESTLEWDTP